MFSPATLIRPHIAALPAYEPILPFEILSRQLGRSSEQIIKLDANENPYGISPSTRDSLARLNFPHIYPDPESRTLRTALAQFTDVPVDNLLAGSGADELIDLIIRIFVEPGDRVINCPPTFGMYSFDTGLNAGQVLEVLRLSDFSLDMDGLGKAVEKDRPKLIFLTSPNNPDGSLIQLDVLTEILSLPVMVVLDEAYIEFADEDNTLGKSLSNIKRVAELENLIVLRTFSKWAGLAGLRIGYGAFPSWLMPTLWKAKQPYNVNVAASEAAIASIEDAAYIAADSRPPPYRAAPFDGRVESDILPEDVPDKRQFFPLQGKRSRCCPPQSRSGRKIWDPGALFQQARFEGLHSHQCR